MARKPRSIACPCNECHEIREAAANRDSVSAVDMQTLQAHQEELVNEVVSHRAGIEMPKGVIAFAMAVMVMLLGWYSWMAGGYVVGAVIGLVLLVNGWTMGSSFTRVNERELRMRLEYECSELRNKLKTSDLDFAGRRLQDAAHEVVREAKIRQEDIDGDDGDEFYYEIPRREMLALADAVDAIANKEHS